MSLAHFLWSSTGSADRPMILVLRLSNSDFNLAMVPSSVVQTGVKSLGCENRIAHLSPIHLWKSIGPSVVCAWKLGASSPIRNAMGVSLRGKPKILRRVDPSRLKDFAVQYAQFAWDPNNIARRLQLFLPGNSEAVE